MNTPYFKNINNFFVAGINYKKSDASIRGQFAINDDQYTTVLQEAAEQGLNEVFILSTCNRTEIYGFAHCSHQLVELYVHKRLEMQKPLKSQPILKTASKPLNMFLTWGQDWIPRY